MGIDLVREMFENATKWNLNVVRIYAHTTDPEHAFMVRAACSLLQFLLPHGAPLALVRCWESVQRMRWARMA